MYAAIALFCRIKWMRSDKLRVYYTSFEMLVLEIGYAVINPEWDSGDHREHPRILLTEEGKAHIIAMDESDVSVGNMKSEGKAGKSMLVLYGEGQTPTHAACSGGVHVTALFAICAAGDTLPPLFIYAGKNMSEAWTKETLSGTYSNGRTWTHLHAISDNGSIDATILGGYLQEALLDPISGLFGGDDAPTAAKPVIICADNHVSRVDIDLLEWATDHHLKFFMGVPHTTARTQTLDVTHFAKLKAHFRKARITAVGDMTLADGANASLSAADVAPILRDGFVKTFTRERNIKSFAEVGLIPCTHSVYYEVRCSP
jgi:hypothetical protein